MKTEVLAKFINVYDIHTVSVLRAASRGIGATTAKSSMSNEDVRRAHGQRMRKLQNAFHVTVKYALRGIPPEEFHVHFPEGAFPEPILEALYDAYTQCLHQARVFIDRDFEDVCEENSIEDKLQALDVMCIEQGIMDGAAAGEMQPNVAAPTKAARRAALRTKQEEARQLQSILAEVQRRNAELAAQLEVRRVQARELLASAVPLQAQLEEAQTVAKAWVNRAPGTLAVV